MKRRSGLISIDVAMLIDQIDDGDIEDEFRARKLHLKVPDAPDAADDIRDAYEELLRGRPTEARAILERILHPKWRDPKDCEKAYAGRRS